MRVFACSPSFRIVPSENLAADYIDPNWSVNFAENYIDSLFPHPPVRHAAAEVTCARRLPEADGYFFKGQPCRPAHSRAAH